VNVSLERNLTNPQVIDEMLSLERDRATYYPLTDALGSVMALTDSTGAVVRTNEYDVYGERAGSTGTGPTVAWGYTGREHDPSGLNYNRGRYLDAARGRWNQPDRLGLFGDGPNFFWYGSGSPVMRRDPQGRKPGDTFSTEEEATVDALGYIRPLLDSTKVEWGGTVYRNGSGRFTYDVPNRGNPVGVNTRNCPAGGVPVAYFHGHPLHPLASDPESFSEDDKFVADRDDLPVYLVTPTGNVKAYFPAGLSTWEKLRLNLGLGQFRGTLYDYGLVFSGVTDGGVVTGADGGTR
jgi:RHS repeat-associated protein